MDDADAALPLRLAAGLLVGASVAALVPLVAPATPARALVAFGASALLLVAAHAAEARRAMAAADAALAAALVAGGSIPFHAAVPAPLGALAALVAVWVALVRRDTPLALLAVPAFFVGARHATGGPMLTGSALLPELAFLVALLSFGALLARQRAARWSSRALAAQGVALALALFPLLDALGVTDAGVAALALTGALTALLAAGVALGERALAATAALLLAFAASAAALLSPGPALVGLALLAGGAALAWRAARGRASRTPTA
ncbi:MAG TPA: hypothetical protein VFH78_04875 [Candidatus Thermoplasmatota archaeon]|nr:hypothetical protein [Candidatus Thermoplasmatota archaeon]